MKKMRVFISTLALITFGTAGQPSVASDPAPDGGHVARYTGMMNQLRTELTATIPDPDDEKAVSRFLASTAQDAKLVKYVVLHEATPKGLAEFAEQGREQARLLEQLLSDPKLMQQMLVADGAKGGKHIPVQYGPAMKIYTDIQKASQDARAGVLQRLALAIALEHAVPRRQSNPGTHTDAPKTVDPVKRYRHYEKAYLDGELDPEFPSLSVWDLRFVVNGDEPDWMLAWGRNMLRNYRPDHIYTSNHGWRYAALVRSNVHYGSGRVKQDRPELHNYQNILMNGGVCGRRAFFGRFILRAFGIPTIKRPSRGHGALARWTPKGWVVNLGPRWGSGWTDTIYNRDRAFLASSQARRNPAAYLQVKRAQWIGDVIGEKRQYGGKGDPGTWNGLSLLTQQKIIEESKAVTLAPLGEEFGEADEPTVAEKVMAAPVTDVDRKITYRGDGAIVIPAAAYSTAEGNPRGVAAMKSFAGGQQVYLPHFGRKGVNLLRGGGEKSSANDCTSGRRIRSAGLGRYPNWGLRVAVTPAAGSARPPQLTLDLGHGITMEFVYIRPGTFVMGGERTTDDRFNCVEVPKHEVEITQGFYLGTYEVTRAQYHVLMSANPASSPKEPEHPAGNIGEGDAVMFCKKATERTGQEVRLPTEAEWEYAARAGRHTLWFFGDDPATLGEYAWFGPNAGGKGKFHPVGQKQPNPWGLYDIYGNVWERVADVYDKDYYAKSPKKDPTGPSQDPKSRTEYAINIPQAGKYALTARVVTMNYEQILNVAANDDPTAITMAMPFTVGEWQDSAPVVLNLRRGENILEFSRTNPPQYGMAVKSFTLIPVK